MAQRRQIFQLSVLKKLLNDKNSCVSLVPTTRLLALPPVFLNDVKSGIIYLLNSILKKYDRTLDGMVIGYQNIRILLDENTGIIQMGTAETEINISVEFYIFQPKIGNCLAGVINKKSNNHIGCLVHKYFNATILKPEDVEYEEWICKDLNVNDIITFKVKDLDFTGVLPYIEGVVDDDMLEKVLVHRGESSSLENNNVDDANKKKHIRFNEIENLADEVKNENLDSTTIKFKFDEVIQSSNQCDENVKKKKKKRKQEKGENEEMEKDLKEKANTHETEEVSFNINSIDQLDGLTKKKKKKKKKEEVDSPETEDFKRHPVQREEDVNVFCSTQIDFSSGNKNLDFFCSPIPSEPTEEKKKNKNSKTKVQELLENLNRNSALEELKVENDKKKHKKSKRKKEDKEYVNNDKSEEKLGEKQKKETSPSSSSIKRDRKSSKKKMNGGESMYSESEDEKLKMQKLMKEIYEKQMNRIKEQWSNSERESSDAEPKREAKKGNPEKNKFMTEGESATTKISSKKRKREEISKRENSDSEPKTKVKENPEEDMFATKDKTMTTKVSPLKRKGEEISERESSDAEPKMKAKKRKREEKSETTKASPKKRKREKSSERESGPTAKKPKNGNMYDYYESPVKDRREDKSLFSDSDTSPVKQSRKINGDVSESESKSQSAVQRILDDLIRKQRESLEKGFNSGDNTTQKESGKEIKLQNSLKKESSKEKKNKKKEESKKVEDNKNSLYEKLLMDAKSLFDSSKDEASVDLRGGDKKKKKKKHKDLK